MVSTTTERESGRMPTLPAVPDRDQPHPDVTDGAIVGFEDNISHVIHTASIHASSGDIRRRRVVIVTRRRTVAQRLTLRPEVHDTDRAPFREADTVAPA